MYQLLNSNTSIYSLHQKKVLTQEDIFDEFRVRSHNFALAKALCGDPGDNIPGIKGLGFKTVSKKLPFLGTDSEVLVSDVIAFCQAHANESVVYKKIIENKADLERNWQLVYLDGSMLSAAQISKVQHAIDTFVPRINKIGLIKSLIKEGISDFDTEEFFYSFNCVEGIRTATGE
jgi:5'-3' exonuclease